MGSTGRLTIEDQFESPYGQMWTAGLRRANCGHVHDSVIEQHHLVRQKKVVAPQSGESNYQDEEVHLGAESFIQANGLTYPGHATTIL